jgi:putative N-acetylmannosamine-6-phosphate epimerase
MRRIPKGALVVSAQARADNPLHGPLHMAAMAAAAAAGGAAAIRANGAEDIAAIRAVCDLPIIGIAKVFDTRFDVYITPDRQAAGSIVAAGADIVALDATPRSRNGEPVADLIRHVRHDLGRPVFADVDDLESGLAAAAAGADYLATTLSGYTRATEARKAEGPDFDLLAALLAATPLPVVAEGRFWEPAQVARAFRMGVHAVVVGTAITNPREITRRFVRDSGAVVP